MNNCSRLAKKNLNFMQGFISATDYGHPMKAQIKEIWKFGPIWQTKYASAVPKNLGVGVDFWPCSGGNFLTRRP